MIKYNYKTKKLEGKDKGCDISFDFEGYYQKPTTKDLEYLQVMVYTMCGGGMLGEFAVRQPAGFYIDTRVGRLPYPNRDILKVIEMIKALCDYLKKDPDKLPVPGINGCYVF